MRLTDRPKTLAEMRPDIAWPPDVQAVMDRALERDAAKRYPTAAEFGRDLHRAIALMPETAAAAMGTEMIDVPPTRVAPPAPTQAQVPATAQARSPSPAPSVPPKRSRMPLVAGLSTIVIVGAGAFAMLQLQRPKTTGADPAGPPASSSAPVAVPQSTTPPAQDTASRAPDNTTQFTAQKPSPPAAGDDTLTDPPTPAGRAANFDRLDKLAAETATAARALRQVERVRIVNDEDRVRAGFVRFKAQLNLGHADEACDALRAVAAIAPGTSKANLVAGNLAACP